jgi:hypothetical protein
MLPWAIRGMTPEASPSERRLGFLAHLPAAAMGLRLCYLGSSISTLPARRPAAIASSAVQTWPQLTQ